MLGDKVINDFIVNEEINYFIVNKNPKYNFVETPHIFIMAKLIIVGTSNNYYHF